MEMKWDLFVTLFNEEAMAAPWSNAELWLAASAAGNGGVSPPVNYEELQRIMTNYH